MVPVFVTQACTVREEEFLTGALYCDGRHTAWLGSVDNMQEFHQFGWKPSLLNMQLSIITPYLTVPDCMLKDISQVLLHIPWYRNDLHKTNHLVIESVVTK